MPEKLDKSQVIGLPEGAAIQFIKDKWYVFFAYCYRLGEKRYQERDYIGTIKDNQFVPNDYYIDHHPDRKHRPLKKWKNPEKAKIERAKAEEALQNAKIVQSRPKDFAKNEPFELSVGASALLMQSLYSSGMVEDLGKVALDGNVTLTTHCINLALHTAVTQKATYLARDESCAIKFIGKGCLTSQRASELHQKLGAIDGLEFKLGKARSARLSEGDLLALDGTRLDCSSDNISLAEVGKRKDGTYGKQLNFSVLFNATTGQCLSYRLYSGNCPDNLTMSDFRQLWTGMGIPEKKAVIVVDRGYYSADEFAKLDHDGIGFIAGAKTNLKAVREVIEEHNSEFYEARNLLRNRGCYAVSSGYSIGSKQDPVDLNLFVYRSPVNEMSQTDELYERLDRIEQAWLDGDTEALGDNDRVFYKDPIPGVPLVRDEKQITQYCYTLGYFAFSSNVVTDVVTCYDDYSFRNEIEVFFKQQKRNGFHCARVQSEATLKGLALTTFIGTAATIDILHRMRRPTAKTAKGLRNNYTVPELLTKLSRVHLVHSATGEMYLTNVTSREKDIVAALGFPGLFDSAEYVDKLLSVSYLAERLKA